MSSLAQLRESLVSLNSYQLPERYQNDPEKLKSFRVDRPVLDEKSFQRYRMARDTYLKYRMTELYLEHLSTYDCIHNNVTLPPLPSAEEEEEIKRVEEKVKADLSDTVLKLKASFRNVYDNYTLLGQRRGELTRVIEDMERDKRSSATLEDEIMAHAEEDVDENDVLLIEEKIQTVIKQRGDLETKLRDMRMEKQELSYQLQQRKVMVKEFILARGAIPSEERFSSGLQIDSQLSLDQLEKEVEQLRQRSRHYRDMADYYNSERCALEEIGGVKILTVVPFENGESSMERTASSSSSQSVARRRRSSSSSSSTSKPSTTLSDTATLKDGILLRLLLLNQHVVKVTLIHHDAPPSSTDGNDEILRVANAQFETGTVLTIPSGRTDSDNLSRNLSITIPPLDDLVRLASQLEPGYDLRFLLHETMARIRSLTARVDELAILRAKYLTKFANISNNYGFGGEDQEVVCSLNAGITVVLRLTADCPILDGSCYIHQLVGVGGWDEGVLQRMKTRVNGMKSRRGPVEVMDSLVEEIGRLERDEGLVLPKTPPNLRKKNESF